MKSRVTEITVTVGQTVQVRQYEPRTYQASVKMVVDESDTVQNVFKYAKDTANSDVKAYFESLKEPTKTNKTEPETKYEGKLKPEILSHPNIPKPLHGIAPRTIMGQKWWDKTRKEVYATADYHCIACGVYKEVARGHAWLEAHEYWDIDYSKGEAKVESIEPLCHYCHNFIHSGRLTNILGGEKSEDEVKEILEHGFKILSENKLSCFPGTLELAKSIKAKTYGVKSYDIPESGVGWNDWKLIFNGEEYKSQFENYEAWQEYYDNKNKGGVK